MGDKNIEKLLRHSGPLSRLDWHFQKHIISCHKNLCRNQKFDESSKTIQHAAVHNRYMFTKKISAFENTKTNKYLPRKALSTEFTCLDFPITLQNASLRQVKKTSFQSKCVKKNWEHKMRIKSTNLRIFQSIITYSSKRTVPSVRESGKVKRKRVFLLISFHWYQTTNERDEVLLLSGETKRVKVNEESQLPFISGVNRSVTIDLQKLFAEARGKSIRSVKLKYIGLSPKNQAYEQ